MLDSHALLSSLHRKGIEIWEDDGQLRYQAQKGALLPEDLRELRRLKNEVLKILRLSRSSLQLPIKPREPGCQVPITATILPMWKVHQLHHELQPEAANCITAVRVRGVLDISLLERCIDAVVRRNEPLRTRIVSDNGVLRQNVMTSSEYSFQTVDLSHLGRENSENEAKRLSRPFSQEKIDTSRGPVFRAQLFRLSHTEHVLFCATDHLVSDGTSKRIVDREIWTLYDRALRGLDFFLNDVPVQFADYAVWQESTHSDWLKEHEAYWREHLRDAPRLRLPIDNSLRRIETADISIRRFSFGEETIRDLSALAQRERTLLSIIILAIYILSISRWCNQRDIVVAVASDGRIRPELEQMTGFISSLLKLRIAILDTDSISQLLKKVTDEFHNACTHYDYGRVPLLIPECHTEAFFNWMPDGAGWSPLWQWTEELEAVTVRPFPFAQLFRTNFSPMFYYTDADVIMTVRYCKNFVSTDEVEKFSQYVKAFTREFARNPASSIASAWHSSLK